MKKLYYIIILSTLTSCLSVHSGYITSSAALTSNNFKYLNKSVLGKSDVFYFLIFGGFTRNALVTDAFSDMKINYPLKDNQVYANTAVNFKTSNYFFGVVNSVKCTVSADIVEFNEKNKPH